MFHVTVEILNEQETSVESLRGPYLVTLSLSPDGVIHGSLSMYTVNGIANFTNLRILSHNTFTITASSSGILSESTSSFSVINYPYFVNLIHVSSNTISRYFDTTYAVDVLGEDNRTFTEGCSLDVSSSDHSINIISIVSPSISNYEIVFYSNTTGQKTLTATCTYESQSATNTTEFEVLSESLKIVSVHPTVRFT